MNNISYTLAPFEVLSLHDELINASLYLSDSALVEAGKKEDVLNSAMIRDVMVANPQSAKSNKVIEALEQREEPLPDELWVEINAGKNQISAKQALEISIADLSAEKALSRTLLMQSYQDENKNDSLRWLLNLVPDPLSAYKSTWTWFDEGNSEYGLNSIQNIDLTTVPENHRIYQNGYVQLAEIINQIASDTSYVLKNDTSALISLQNLTLNDNPAGISARNLLTSYRLMEYEAFIPVPDTSLKSAIATLENPKKVREGKTSIYVFPNPATDYTIVSYNIEGSCAMELVSQDGRLIRSENLKSGKNQYLLRTGDLPSGVYTLKLKGSNKSLTTKLVIR